MREIHRVRLPRLLVTDIKHGQHLAFDAKNNVPLCNLFVQMLQRMGQETNAFGSSTATSVPGLV